MKKLYLTKQNFLNEIEPEVAYEFADVNVDSLDCGDCKVADMILQSAMGIVNGARDPYTGEVIAAWWMDGDEYQGWIELSDGARCFVSYTISICNQRHIEVPMGTRKIDYDDLVEIDSMF